MLCLIQARMSSKRLPGKILKKINGLTILEHIIKRLKKSKRIKKIIVATSIDKSDDLTAKLCKKKKIKFYRGSLNDVAKRFAEILEKLDEPAFVRICGDSPLIDPALVDKIVGIFESSKYDLVTNVFPKSFPKGQSIEVLKTKVFFSIIKKLNTKIHKEHITKYIYENSKKFSIYCLKNKYNLNNINLCVDTKKDFEKIKKLFFFFNPKPGSFKEIVKTYKKLF